MSWPLKKHQLFASIKEVEDYLLAHKEKLGDYVTLWSVGACPLGFQRLYKACALRQSHHCKFQLSFCYRDTPNMYECVNSHLSHSHELRSETPSGIFYDPQILTPADSEGEQPIKRKRGRPSLQKTELPTPKKAAVMPFPFETLKTREGLDRYLDEFESTLAMIPENIRTGVRVECRRFVDDHFSNTQK